MRFIFVVGTRPNFIKIASIMRACKECQEMEILLIHTGQHYTNKMNKIFFKELDIPFPDINLGIGSGNHSYQTADIMKGFYDVVKNYSPDAVLTVGDVNSTLACSLVCAKENYKLIHYESGLRSFDRKMPEEINRVVTDSISDYLLVTEPSGLINLGKEGVDQSKIYFVGNVMIDTLDFFLPKVLKSKVLSDLNLSSKRYCTLTLHRPGNVDENESLNNIIDALEEIQKEIKIVFPIHPRTEKSLKNNNLMKRIKELGNLFLIKPLGYIDFIKLISESKMVLTDSGGIQSETTILNVPCLTLRDNTERPITIANGTNLLVGTYKDSILKGYKKQLGFKKRSLTRPTFWDGHSSERISKLLMGLF